MSGFRATTRLARRDAARNRGRSALIALMIALPVLAASVVSVVYRSDQRDPQDWSTVLLGSQSQAQLVFEGQRLRQTTSGLDFQVTNGAGLRIPREGFAAQVSALLPAGDRLVERSRGRRTLLLGDRGFPATLEEFDYAAAGVGGLVEQLSGRAPAASGEVVVSRSMARRHRIKIGDQLGYPVPKGAARSLRVVGIVGGIPLTGQSLLIGPPGSLLPADPAAFPGQSPLLVVGPHPIGWDRVQQLNQLGYTVTSRAVLADPPAGVPHSFGDNVGYPTIPHLTPASSAGVITVGIGLVLLQIALLAGPAIAVGARRNERSLALVAVSGGNRAQLRAVVLAGNGLIGLVSCTVAAMLGVGIAAAAVPLLRRYADQPLVRTDVHALDLLVLVAVGTGTAVAAALLPARQAARLDLVAVLTGRRGRISPARRIPVIGALVTLGGALLCLFGAVRGHPFLTVLGIAIAEIGLITTTGSILAGAARIARWLSFAGRFAIRDSARQRGRTAPAIAAVVAALAGSVAVGTYYASMDRVNRLDYRQLGAVGTTWATLPGIELAAGQQPSTPVQAVTEALRKTLPVSAVAGYSELWAPNSSPMSDRLRLIRSPAQPCPATDEYALDHRRLKYQPYLEGDSCGPRPTDLYAPPPGRELVDDGSVLQIMTGVPHPAARAALAAGKVVVSEPELLWPDGTVHLRLPGSVEYKKATTDRVAILPGMLDRTRPGLDSPVYPRTVAETLGIPVYVTGVVAGTTRVPSASEEDEAEAIAGAAISSLGVERGYHRVLGPVLLAILVAAPLVTLGGTFAAVGLAAAEGRADISVLAAIGAAPGVRRRIVAAQAAVITMLGSGLGLVSGLLSGWALVRLRGPSGRQLGDRPWFSISAGPAGWPFVVPWTAVLVLVIGVPLLAVAIGYLSTRSRFPIVRRLGQ